MNEEDLEILDELSNPMTRPGWAVINAVERIRALENTLDELLYDDGQGNWYNAHKEDVPVNDIVGDLMDTRTRELKS